MSEKEELFKILLDRGDTVGLLEIYRHALDRIAMLERLNQKITDFADEMIGEYQYENLELAAENERLREALDVQTLYEDHLAEQKGANK